jgi:hypothetical protein
MSLKPDAPRSIGGVLDVAFRVYARSILPCMPLVLIATVVMVLPSLLMGRGAAAVTPGDPAAVLASFTSPAVLLSYFAALVVTLVVYGALFAKIDAIARDERMAAGTALKVGLSRFPVTLGVSILFGLMVMVGCLLLLIPGVYLWGVFQLAFIPPILERAGVFASFSTSARLVKGNWWRASVIVFVGTVMIMVVVFVMSAIAGVLAGIGAAAGAGISDAAGVTATAQAISLVISAISNLFTLTFFPSVLLAVYYDLKLRNEGADLASRVGELNATA